MELILLFFGWSLTSLLVNGSIFDPVKNYFAVMNPFIFKLLSCVQCTSVWIGVIVFYPCLLFIPEYVIIFPYGWMDFIFYPVIQSGFAVLFESIIIWLRKEYK